VKLVEHGWMRRPTFKEKQPADLGDALFRLYVYYHDVAWYESPLRARTRDGDRQTVRDRRIARGMRLLARLHYRGAAA
jgi:hypothetical protein